MRRILGFITSIARWFGLGRLFSLILLILLVQLRAWDPLPLETIRLKTFDLYQWLQPRILSEQPVVIVDIDEKSLESIGQWPWPRTIVAKLIDQISKAGAKAVAFDIAFSEQDRLSPNLLADVLPNLDEITQNAMRNARSNDQIMADSIGKSKVILAQSGIPVAKQQFENQDWPETAFAILGTDPAPYVIKYPHLLHNVPILEKSASGRGLFTISPEIDGIVRRIPLIMMAGGKLKPSLALELLRVGNNVDTILVRANELGVESIVVGDIMIPTDERGRFWVNFTRHEPSRYVSAKDVLDGTEAVWRKLKDKLVLVGTSAVGLLDLKATPVDPAMPGVEIHAQIIETILTNSYLSRPGFAAGVEVLMSLIIGLFIILFAPILGAFIMLILGGGVAAGLVAASWYFYTQYGFLFDVGYPLVSTFVVYSVLVFYNYFQSERSRREVRAAFGQYLSPELVNQLANNPERLSLGGETREVTILFSDVRNFTAVSEQYKEDPAGLTKLMNDLLTPLSNAVMERKGTIDKYMGDAIMAFWNAPLDDSDHPSNACASALEMQKRLKALNNRLRSEAEKQGFQFTDMRAGIGINTGYCVVGNMGSEMRFDYTAMGDPVNIASRIEGLTKQLGVDALVGEQTALNAEGFALLEADLIRVIGKQQPERVFFLAGDQKIATQSEFSVLAKSHQTMLDAYRSQDWSKALEALENSLSTSIGLFDLSRLYGVYKSRIEEFMENGAPENWDGVYEATTK